MHYLRFSFCLNSFSDKIVLRFYETPAPLKAGRDLFGERLKFLSPFEFIPRCPDLAGSPLRSDKQRGIQI